MVIITRDTAKVFTMTPIQDTTFLPTADVALCQAITELK